MLPQQMHFFFSVPSACLEFAFHPPDVKIGSNKKDAHEIETSFVDQTLLNSELSREAMYV
jgi:hypothetical protein